jgi:hypothetical protein
MQGNIAPTATEVIREGYEPLLASTLDTQKDRDLWLWTSHSRMRTAFMFSHVCAIVQLIYGPCSSLTRKSREPSAMIFTKPGYSKAQLRFHNPVHREATPSKKDRLFLGKVAYGRLIFLVQSYITLLLWWSWPRYTVPCQLWRSRLRRKGTTLQLCAKFSSWLHSGRINLVREEKGSV